MSTMMQYADLHTHTSASDGLLSPRDLARRFLEYKNRSFGECLSDLDAEIDAYSRLGLDKRPLYVRAEQMVSIARNLRTLGKLDHVTLLGTADMLSELSGAKDRRFVIGTELSAPFHFPFKGDGSMHISVYFFDKDGFDMLSRKPAEQREFARRVDETYHGIIDHCVQGLNRRWLVAADNANRHFNINITEEELHEHALSRLRRVIDPMGLMKASGRPISINHMDISRLVHARGIGDSAQEVASEYFGRDKILYAPFKPDFQALDLESLLSTLNSTSDSSDIKAIAGISHPQTYIREMARKIGGPEWYGTSAEIKSVIAFENTIISLAQKGLISFIETEYPEHQIVSKDPAQYLSLLENERNFNSRMCDWSRELAKRLSLKASGGSDTHGTFYTPKLGYGFGTLTMDDELVDSLFKDAIQQ